MKYCLLVFFPALFLCSRPVHAQSGYVYEDSSILYNEPEEETGITEDGVQPIEDEVHETTISNNLIPDTHLVKNRHLISPDSAKKLQDEKRFEYAKKLDSLLKAMKDKPRPKREYRSDGPSWLAGFFNSPALQYVLWGLAIVFVLFIVFRLFFTGGFFAKATARTKVKVIEEEEEEKPVNGKDLDMLIANAVKQQNYRLATRYLYLQLLQKLSAAGAIELSGDKTNSTYLQELSGKPYKQEVAALTLYYEYAWYGEFAISPEIFERLQARFKALAV